MKKLIQEGDQSVVFNCELNAGPVTLHTWFDGQDNKPLAGAYYVYVTKVKLEDLSNHQNTFNEFIRLLCKYYIFTIGYFQAFARHGMGDRSHPHCKSIQ